MKEAELSKVAEELLTKKGFRFRIGQEVHRNLQQAKLNSKFLNMIDKKLVSWIGWVRALDRHL